MTHPLATFARTLLAALLLAAATSPLAGAQDATPVTDPALEQQLSAIAAETAEIRGLDALPDIDDIVLTRDELVQRLPTMISEDLDPSELNGANRPRPPA
jgi:hypothetical protein